MSIYRVERDNQAWEFQTANEVKIFMWGRDFDFYHIYKLGRLFPWSSGDLAAFEKALEAF